MALEIVHVVGARPNYMKIAPVWVALARRDGVGQRLVHTGQHYDPSLKDVFFSELPLPAPDVELATGSGTHAEQTAAALVGLERAFRELGADVVVAPGDVNSTLAAALAAVKLEIPVVHVEAGLRSRDPSMPEEHNRIVADHLGTLLLTHSEEANENLRREGIPDERVAFVGNTMIDTLRRSAPAAEALAQWEAFGLERGTYLLVTLHRPKLVDDPASLERTLAELGRLAPRYPAVFPVHPRTRARIDAAGLDVPPGVVLTEPLPYGAFLSLELGAGAVLTDSGGVQEETSALGVPCFTLRANTERPVTITHGTNHLLGLDPGRIADIPALLEAGVAGGEIPLWDGNAGERAADAIVAAFD
ncbi:MAG TPA: UDP-N-acetylglucosamine 2-epimerase (non-hydrolyzing) [Gaiellaceae bacterium]|nr:UDP-N-acetylglucosamine 2-epimerase (non-hydrolyzing) [Gaiellaceae bacterium]